MSSLPIRVRRFLVAVSIAAAVLLAMPASASRADWPSGQVYRFVCSGNAIVPDPWLSGVTRTFGSAPTQVTSGAFVESFWDSTDQTGLTPNQVRLQFHYQDQTPGGGVTGALAWGLVMWVNALTLPSGAAYLPDTAMMTFQFHDGSPSVSIGQLQVASGIFFISGATFPLSGEAAMVWFDADTSPRFGGTNSGFLGANHVTYEIVVDNVPEPATMGLLGAAAAGLAVRAIRRRRRPEV